MSKLHEIKSTFTSKLGLNKPKRKDISPENLKAIAKMIKEEHPDWAALNDDILIMLLKFVILQYPADQFDNIPEQEVREKIRNAFINSTKLHKNLKDIASPYEIQRLNEAYENGRRMGVKGKTMLNAVFNQLKKTIKPINKDLDQKNN
jgi:hypothetical protein